MKGLVSIFAPEGIQCVLIDKQGITFPYLLQYMTLIAHYTFYLCKQRGSRSQHGENT